jgi:chromosome segregation ATPase
MVRVALACALALLGASADDLNSEHMGLLQAKNRGQVGVHTHTGDAPVITFDESECILWGLVCPHKVFNDMEAAAQTKEKLLKASITSTESKIGDLQTRLATVKASTLDLGQKKVKLAHCTSEAQAAILKLKEDMDTSEDEFINLSEALEEQIDELESRMSKAIQGVLEIQQALAGGSADSPSLLQKKGFFDWLEMKRQKAKKLAVKWACDNSDVHAGHKCKNRIVGRQSEHQAALNNWHAKLTGLEASLKQEDATLDSSLTDEDAAQKAFEKAETTNAGVRADLTQLEADQKAQEKSQATTQAELRESILELETIAASFSERLANTLIFE